jgi:hypothetical protein
LFEGLGTPVPSDIATCLRGCHADENNCRFSFDKDSVETVTIDVRMLSDEAAMELGTLLDTRFNKRKWIDFTKTLSRERIISLQLTRQGFLMYQTVHF